ncbi:hypothetical protein SAMN05660443_2920 [Marinospirillum celere]|uniref:Cytochrome c-type biogenesis protein n=1 Tax=Marinospirillum celere TaxID=1122252 RepID=A0A1I1JXW5_9GAMM|nr:hypothetical protein [Marinospirillum celere]SFC51328.1 hypothetical protein SAMN05660443_2920 [Marinospirillum celere]
MKSGLASVCLLYGLLVAQPAWSGLDIDQYLPPQETDLSPEEQRQQREAVQRQIEEARQREAQRAQKAEQARQAEAERLAARPYPVRLTEKRCLTCHSINNLEENPQTRLGWELTVLRMDWFQGAQLERGDRKVLAQYLATTYPARGLRSYLEYLLLGLALFLPVFAGYQLRQRHQKMKN